MTCKDTIRMMCEYLEGRLSPSVSEQVRQHVARCTNCTVVLQAAQQTLEVYFDAGEPAVPRPAPVA